MSTKSQIETLLLIAARPMSAKQLAELTKASIEEIKVICNELINEYREEKKGIQIIKSESKYQMVSASENAKLVQQFIKDETTGELTRPSLETLTIIAYREPISKIDLDRIRGVNCALILRNLLMRGLIEPKFDKKKQETYYHTTLDFVRFLGLNSVAELPDYEQLHQNETIDKILAGEAGSE